MRGDERYPVVEGHAAEGGVDATALPLHRCEPAEERQRFLPPLAQSRERRARIVSKVLTFLGPPVGIEWERVTRDDSPRRGVERHLAEDKERGLVHGEHRAKPDHEELLEVPEVAHDLLGGPALPVRATREDGVAAAADRGGKVVGRACDALETVCEDRKSTRLNSSHGYISYAVFCLEDTNF